jgi:hypothetical protein
MKIFRNNKIDSESAAKLGQKLSSMQNLASLNLNFLYISFLKN